MKKQTETGPQSLANVGSKITRTPQLPPPMVVEVPTQVRTTVSATTGSTLSRADVDQTAATRSGSRTSSNPPPVESTPIGVPTLGVQEMGGQLTSQSTTTGEGVNSSNAGTQPGNSRAVTGQAEPVAMTGSTDRNSETSSNNGRTGADKAPVQHGIKFAQLNMHHSKSATAEMQMYLNQLGPASVGLLQEPWHIRGTVKGLNSPERSLFSTGGIADTAPRAVISCTKDLSPIFGVGDKRHNGQEA